MLDIQNLPKSSESHVEIPVPPTDSAAGVYLDRDAALRDFDGEKQTLKSKFQPEKMDATTAGLLANARVLTKHNEYQLALNLLRTASNRESKNPLVLNPLAECLECLQKFSEAMKVREVLARLETNFDNLQKLATLLYKQGQDEKALTTYYEALSLLKDEDQALFEIYKNVGNILVRQGDFEGAEDFYNKAYTLNPHSDTLLVNFGTLEVQRQDFEKSLYCFRQAVEINKQNDKAWVGLAMVHSEFGDYDLAWANLEAAVDINPRNRTAVLLIANWGLRDRRVDRSIQALQDYLGRVEFDEDMSLVLINLYCDNSQIEEARLECERVLLWNPEHREVLELRKKLKHVKKA